MATPSEAEVQDIGRRIIKSLNELRQYGDVNADNLDSLDDALVQAIESDWASEIIAAHNGLRARVAAGLTADATSMMIPWLWTYAKQMGVPERNPQDIIDRIVRNFRDNNLRVTTRGFTFGTLTAGGSNIGTGTILRKNVDEFGYALEAQSADAKTCRCIRDQNSGAYKHEEIFELRGAQAGRDAVKLGGSGLVTQLRAISARDSLALNPSFSQYSGTLAAPTALTNWTSSVTVNGTNYTVTTTSGEYYRDFQGDATPTALKVNVTATLSQAISLRGLAIDPKVPYFMQIAWNREIGSAGGTLVIRMGAVSATVTVAAQTGWQILRIPLDWLRNMSEADLDLRIEWTRTSGILTIDDVIFAPASAFDGSWYAIVGSATPFLYDDVFTWADSEVGSIIQYWFWRIFRRSLPSAIVAPTVAPTDALAGAGAGGVDNGLHYYKYTYTDDLGRESAGSPISDGVTVADKTVDGQVTITWTAGPANVTGAKIYRTVAGGAGDYKLVAADAASPYTDTTADADLGAVMPTQDVTWAEPTS